MDWYTPSKKCNSWERVEDLIEHNDFASEDCAYDKIKKFST